MKHIDWSESKNQALKKGRKVCFEDVISAIADNRVLADATHPSSSKYPHQRLLTVEIEGYAYLVPYIEDSEKLFLKTIIPSRKATKHYLRGEKS